jgi:coenzyme F420-reducing hydrogenase gamma subunit
VWKFASCDGCQLSLLDCEDELLELVEHVRIAYFLEASSSKLKGPFDLSLVEGSITNAKDVDRLREIRENSRVLVTIGACATSGGIQALRNFADIAEYASAVYPFPDRLADFGASEPASAHVTVDFELWGCPIDRSQLLSVIRAVLRGDTPVLPSHTVCVECKRRGHVCVSVAGGVPCMGVVTRTGCGALCPAHGRGCYGCFGPTDDANTAAFASHFIHQGVESAQIVRMFRTFNASAGAFSAEGRRHDSSPNG